MGAILGSIYAAGAIIILSMGIVALVKRDPYMPYAMAWTFAIMFSGAAYVLFFLVPSP